MVPMSAALQHALCLTSSPSDRRVARAGRQTHCSQDRLTAQRDLVPLSEPDRTPSHSTTRPVDLHPCSLQDFLKG
ncbi:hypothetical protein DPEC_G00232280 [Dallia pectoralis]|uniref:Uncharacterized protein n=1 Tax=Dallia pectoralis TaxID=75939 RepID=A0ACC2FXD9_DALPE|nr:hypothetical protein DPEC_G00232280 [Dallia pectoralis]